MARAKISLDLARRLALHAQLLDGGDDLPAGKEGAAQIIERLGYVQIDTIAVIHRAHHHTLWTRLPDYDAGMLHDLLATDRSVFEYWGHAASYLPISDYRFYLPRMERARNEVPTNQWARQRWEQSEPLFEPILQRIRREGALGSKDFEPPPGAQRGTWWDRKPAKVALEILFTRGELMISERHNFQRRYDLTERVLPDDTDTRMPDDQELGAFLVRRALGAYGVAQAREIADHIHAASKEVVEQALAALVDSGDVIAVQVGENEEADYYAFPQTVDGAASLSPASHRVALLSPFDNLIIQRTRLEQLFDFTYRLECYTPAAKRSYGYFVLPILWDERFVGRLDPKAERKSRTLIVRNLVFEPHFADFDPFLPPFARALSDLARFNGCERVSFEAISAPEIEEPLTRALAQLL